jgi:hypothetical protein
MVACLCQFLTIDMQIGEDPLLNHRAELLELGQRRSGLLTIAATPALRGLLDGSVLVLAGGVNKLVRAVLAVFPTSGFRGTVSISISATWQYIILICDNHTSAAGHAVVVVGQEVQEAAVGDGNDVVITVEVAGEVAQGQATLAGAGGELLEGGLEAALRALIDEAGIDAAQVDAVAELGGQLFGRGADIAWIGRDLLEHVESDDGQRRAIATSEAVQAGVQGASERRRNQPGETLVVAKDLAQQAALVLAQRRQVRVVQRLVLDRQVVEALRVAHEVDGGRHGFCGLGDEGYASMYEEERSHGGGSRPGGDGGDGRRRKRPRWMTTEN